MPADLALGVRLDGDSGKLVGQLNRAEAAARGLEGEFDKVAAASKRVDQATKTLAVAQADAKARIDLAKSSLQAGEITQERYNQTLLETKNVLGGVEREYKTAIAAQTALATSQQKLTAAQALNTGSSRQQSAAYQQLGFQMQDVFQQAALGVNPLVILAQQGGQTASAIALMGDRADGTRSKMVGFATFLSGPWGAALFGAATIVGFLVQNLLEAEEASELAEAGADGLAEAQSVLGKIFDEVSGKIEKQNELLILNARLAAINLRAEATAARASSEQTLGTFEGQKRTISAGNLALAPFGLTDLTDELGQSNRAKQLVRRFRAGEIDSQTAVRESESIDFDGLAITRAEFMQAFADALSADAKEATAALIDESLDSGVLAPEFRKDEPRRRTRRRGVRGDQLADFGESAGEKVERVLAEYDPAPRGIDKALQDLRTLDALIAELGQRRPPNFEETIASAREAQDAVREGLAEPIAEIADRFSDTPKDLAETQLALADLDAIAARLEEAQPPNLQPLLNQIEEARGAVRESLVAPFQQILTDQRQQLDLLRLASQGRYEEASQLELIHSLMRQVGAESEDQLATELLKRGVGSDILDQMMRNLALQDRLTEKAQRRADIEREHIAEVQILQGQIETFFVDVQRDGLKAVGDFASGIQDQTGEYFARYLTDTLFGGVFQRIEDQLTGEGQLREAQERQVDQIGNVVNALVALETAAARAAGEIDPTGPDITVTGERVSEEEMRLKSPRELFGAAAKELLTELGLGDLAEDVGDKVGIALEGAVFGQFGSSLLLGESGNRTTAALGGALGQVAGEEFGKGIEGFLGSALGPIGGIAGGILGGLAGGLFQKRDYGTVVLSGAGDGRERFNDDTARGIAGGLGDNVQEGLARIAEALGAELGNYRVSIGTYKDEYRVSTTGFEGKLNFAGDSKVGLHSFGDDKSAAVAFAIADAIGDGGIAGVSAAVQKALRSSKDLDKAIEEALAVKDIEDMLSGLNDGISEELRAFTRIAEERLRIGREYGFDLVELERRNAEERADIVASILADRVGSLQDLIADLEFGDLAEGSLAERRQRLLAEIANAESEAEAGEDGAADRLASLNRQLIDLSREAYGTAGGEYGDDRDQAIASAERIIALEEERLKNNQAEVTGRLDEGNRLSNEANDILLRIDRNIERLGLAPGGFGSPGGGFGRGLDTQREIIR